MNIHKYVQFEIPSGTDSATLIGVAKMIEAATRELRAIGVQTVRTSFHCDFDGTRRLTVGASGGARVAKQLFAAGKWFEVTPLPDAYFEFTVKNEPLPMHLSELFSPANDLVAEIEKLQQQK